MSSMYDYDYEYDGYGYEYGNNYSSRSLTSLHVLIEFYQLSSTPAFTPNAAAGTPRGHLYCWASPL